MDDSRLLDRFCTSDNSSAREAAFAELVRRHAAWLFAAARRQLAGDDDAAGEATQATFVVLARKARGLRLRSTLTAWLAAVLRRVIGRLRRDVARRRSHETLAATPDVACDVDPADAAAWRELAPLVDDAVARLRAADREAILLRFYRRLSYVEVGAALNVSEEAARKRVERAVERLRATFRSRGVTVGATAATATVLWNQATATAAPAGLIAVAATAPWSRSLAPAAAGGGGGAKLVAIAAAGAMIAAVGAAALVLPTPPIAATPPAIATRPSVVGGTLRNGVGVDLLGIAAYPSEEHDWFAADGTRLATRPYPSLGVRSSTGEGRVQREYAFALRDDTPDNGPATVDLTGHRAGSRPPSPPMPRYGWYAPLDASRLRSVPGVRGALVADVPGRAPPLWFAVAAGPRVTRLASRADAETSAAAQDGVDALAFGLPFEDDGASSIVYTTTHENPNPSVIRPRQDVRVVAIDVDGGVHAANHRSPNYFSPADRARLPVLDAVLPRFEVAGVAFEEALRMLSDQSRLKIDVARTALTADGFDATRPVTVRRRDARVADVLLEVIEEAHLHVIVRDDGVAVRPFEYDPNAPVDRRTHTLYVDGLPLARLARFEVQSRGFDQWISFEGVSSEPGVGGDVVVRTSDDEVPATVPAGRAGR